MEIIGCAFCTKPYVNTDDGCYYCKLTEVLGKEICKIKKERGKLQSIVNEIIVQILKTDSEGINNESNRN